MLKKENRLNKSLDIELVIKKGRSFFNQNFTLKYLPNEKEIKITVIVSNKVSKSAVKRNRIKRILRDELYKNIDNMKSGYYVLLAKPLIANILPLSIRENLKQVLQKSKIIKNA